ncbi:MAG: T9SS type A sorting domain-containing protein [Bacteroidota bacterium]
MKKQLHLLFLLFATCGAFPLFGAQLSGTYNIDSSLTLGTATDFRDFRSALAYLTGRGTRTDGGPANTAPFGVSGPVTFNVLTGTYTEQVNIPAITGASSVNTITFDGGTGNNATRILEFTATSTTNAHTLRFDTAAFINVKNITIKANATIAGIAVHLFGASNSITISNCSLIAASTATNLTKVVSTQNNILSSDGGGCSGSGAAVHTFYLDSNYISGGYIGVFLTSTNTTGLFNYYIRWNTIENAYITGVGLSNPRGWKIEGNYIKTRPGIADSKGIHQCNGSISGSHSYQALNNIIENAGFHGIFLQSANPGSTTTFPNLIINNYMKPTFANAAALGFSCSQTRNFKIANNTILMNVAGGIGLDCGGAAMANTSVKNNIVMLQNANSTGLCIQSDAGTVDSCNYNVFIKNTSDPNPLLVKLKGISYTKNNFKGGAGFNINSYTSDPLLFSLTNPAPANICQKGTALGYVTKDLFGANRPNPPQIGCAEGQGGLAVDAEVISFALPLSYPVVSGVQDAKVVIRNSGNSNLTSLTVKIEIAGGSTYTVYYTGNLSACQYDTVTFNGGNQVFLAPGTNKLKAWCSDANWTVDSNAVNDTITKSFCTPLVGGTYTIDSSGAGNFTSFTQVADALNCGGISGPVTFNVVKGTYNEQFFLGEITGSSAVNTITFQSLDANADSVIVISNSPVRNYVVQLFSTSYVAFKNISFIATNAANGRVFDISGIALYDTIMGCKLTAPVVATTTNVCAILFANGFAGKGLFIKGNAFRNGSMAIYLYGQSTALPSDSNVIDNNSFNASYFYSVYAYYCSNLKIRNNNITGSAYSNHYGISTDYCNLALEIINNRVILFGTAGYGIRGSLNAGSAAAPGLIMNNVVTGGTTGSFYALWNQQCAWQNYYHNTLNNNSSGATSYAAYFYNTTTYTNINIRNNIFSNNGTGGYPVYQYDPLFNSSDYNLFYTRSTGVAYRGLATATGYATLDAYRTAYPLQEKNSIVYLTGFTSPLNLEPNLNDSAVWATNGRGIFLPTQTRDINGNLRPMTIAQGTPDVGASEITPLSLPPMATAVPAIPVDGTTQVFLFAGDTVGKIYWEQFWPVPTELAFRAYPGVAPTGTTLNTHNVLNTYWTLHIPMNSYNFKLDVRFKPTCKGSIGAYADLRIARYDSLSAAWVMETGSVCDSLLYRITNTGGVYYQSLLIAGTSQNNPLPVKLSHFNASAVNNDVYVSWSTASEKNASHFILEASVDGKTFNAIGKVTAAGNSSVTRTYRFTHTDAQRAMNGSPLIYYRLSSADKDGSIEYSRIALVNFDSRNTQGASVYPNPFVQNLTLNVVLETADVAVIEVADIGGRVITNALHKDLAKGTNELMLPELNNLEKGVYFIKITTGNQSKVIKVVKE